jgi:hypothetical protein
MPSKRFLAAGDLLINRELLAYATVEDDANGPDSASSSPPVPGRRAGPRSASPARRPGRSSGGSGLAPSP